MNRYLRKVFTYVKMVLLFMVLGAIVLYFAGTPLASLIIAKGNMLIVNGAPGHPGENTPQISKLVLNKNSTADQSEIQVPESETEYGTITCERIALSAPVYYGDSDDTLLKGIGQYPNGVLPGDGKPLLMSGHDATFFAPLEQIKIGDIITISTDYGIYTYSVTTKIITEATDNTAYDLTQDKEQLILYTCYPFGELVGNRNKRFFVYCDRITDTGNE